MSAACSTWMNKRSAQTGRQTTPVVRVAGYSNYSNCILFSYLTKGEQFSNEGYGLTAPPAVSGSGHGVVVLTDTAPAWISNSTSSTDLFSQLDEFLAALEWGASVQTSTKILEAVSRVDPSESNNLDEAEVRAWAKRLASSISELSD
jgi:hypothetical protein